MASSATNVAPGNFADCDTIRVLLCRVMHDDVQLIIVNIGGDTVCSETCERLLKTIRDLLPNVPVAVISDHEDLQEASSVFAAQAQAFIPTTLEASFVLLTLGFVMDGGTFFPPNILQDWGTAAPDHAPLDLNEGYGGGARPTPRQQEVLNLLCEGKSNKVIARELDMQESTVKVHVRQIMRKLNASNRTQAALAAIQMRTGAEDADQPDPSDQVEAEHPEVRPVHVRRRASMVGPFPPSAAIHLS